METTHFCLFLQAKDDVLTTEEVMASGFRTDVWKRFQVGVIFLCAENVTYNSYVYSL